MEQYTFTLEVDAGLGRTHWDDFENMTGVMNAIKALREAFQHPEFWLTVTDDDDKKLIVWCTW